MDHILTARATQLVTQLKRRVAENPELDLNEMARLLRKKFKDENPTASDYESADYEYDLECALQEVELVCCPRQNPALSTAHQTPLSSSTQPGTRKRSRSSSLHESASEPKDDTLKDHVQSSIVSQDTYRSQVGSVSEDCILASFDDISHITLQARVIAECLQVANITELKKCICGMFLRIRCAAGYMLACVRHLDFGTVYTYSGKQHSAIFSVRSCQDPGEIFDVKLDNISNSSLLSNEYEEASKHFNLPSASVAQSLRIAWFRAIPPKYGIPFQADSIAIDSMQSPKSHIVVEKLQVQKLLQSDLTPGARHELVARLKELEHATDDLLANQSETVDMFVWKTQENKRVNRRPPHVWERISTTVFARVSKGSTFWEYNNTAEDASNNMKMRQNNASNSLETGNARFTMHDFRRLLPVLNTEDFEAFL